MAGSLVELYVNELSRTDEITSGVGANKLLKYWPPALTEWSTKGVRDAFFSSPQLPRLLDADTIKRTIADGVSQGALGYATKENGQVKLLHFNESLSEADVEIADDVYILKAEEAQKLLEPPRLDRLKMRPAEVTIKPGEQASFACSGIDQYGELCKISQPTSSPKSAICNGLGDWRFLPAVCRSARPFADDRRLSIAAFLAASPQEDHAGWDDVAHTKPFAGGSAGIGLLGLKLAVKQACRAGVLIWPPPLQS